MRRWQSLPPWLASSIFSDAALVVRLADALAVRLRVETVDLAELCRLALATHRVAPAAAISTAAALKGADRRGPDRAAGSVEPHPVLLTALMRLRGEVPLLLPFAFCHASATCLSIVAQKQQIQDRAIFSL